MDCVRPLSDRVPNTRNRPLAEDWSLIVEAGFMRRMTVKNFYTLKSYRLNAKLKTLKRIEKICMV